MPVNKELSRKGIPFLVPDLPSAAEISPYLNQIDNNRWYSNFGPLQDQLEQRLLGKFFPSIPAKENRLVGCSSGTAAIELALLSLGLPKNAKVLVPSFTFAATATAVVRAGYQPIFCDVDEFSWMVTPEIVKDILNFITVDAVVPVAALGSPVDVDAWDQFTTSTGIPVVIDAAAALGEQASGVSVITCFSLHATKTVGIGEGGVVVLPNTDLANDIRSLSNFGFEDNCIQRIGSNYKLSEYHAAVGLAQIARVETVFGRREAVKTHYAKWGARFKEFGQLQMPSQGSSRPKRIVDINRRLIGAACSLKLNSMLGDHVGEIISLMSDAGIGMRRWYNPVLHLQPVFRSFETVNSKGGRLLTQAESLSRCLIGFPFHNHLEEQHIQRICDKFVSIVERKSILTDALDHQ